MSDAPRMATPTAPSPDAADALLAAHTRAVLEFRLGGATAPEREHTDPSAPDAAPVRQATEKALRLAVRSGRPHLVLLGAGNGLLPDALADALAKMDAPPRLTLCDLAPDTVRAALAAGRMRRFASLSPTAPRLLVDTSPWALLLLLRGTGMTPETATLFPNPFLSDAQAGPLHRWRRLFSGCKPLKLPSAPAAVPPCLGVGAILHPGEPDLAAFFGQVPGWVREMAVVWDGAPPGFDPAALCPVALRQTVRPLGGDFSAQRNAMLGQLSTEWCLYLDADERLSPDAWALLPRLMAMPDAGAWLLPRATVYPDADHLRTGYGLWPDVQLRLFRRAPEVRFEGAVHERLAGAPGHTCLLADVWIEHLSWIAKDRDALAERLRVFDTAGAPGGGRLAPGGLHRLSAEYPALPRRLFTSAGLVRSGQRQDSAPRNEATRHLALRLPLSP